MELFQLRYLLKVIELGTFTRAAEACGVSQPALSQAILKLEKELGQPVFDRLGRTVQLTDAGRALQQRAEQVTRLIDEARSEISDDGHMGRVRLAAIPTVAPYLLPEVVAQFCQSFPDVQIEIHEDTTERCLKRCRQGETDIAIIALPIDGTWLEVEPLFEEELYLVMPTGHSLADRARITVADLKKYPFVLLNEAHCLSGNIRSFCASRSFQPGGTGRLSQLATVLELVAIGHGISLIPQMARKLDDSQRRVYRSLAGEKPMRGIALCWNSYRFQSRVVKQMLDHLRSQVSRR